MNKSTRTLSSIMLLPLLVIAYQPSLAHAGNIQVQAGDSRVEVGADGVSAETNGSRVRVNSSRQSRPSVEDLLDSLPDYSEHVISCESNYTVTSQQSIYTERRGDRVTQRQQTTYACQ